MSRKIPTKIFENIYSQVATKAEAAGYGNIGPSETSKFIDQLVTDASVGNKLKEYLPNGKIRTYIKDTLLDKYNRSQNEVPQDVSKYISNTFRCNTLEVEYEKHNRVSLHRFEHKDNHLLVVARGTFTRWETALRKALAYIVRCHAKNKTTPKIEILLVISANRHVVTSADEESLRKALDIVGVKLALLK